MQIAFATICVLVILFGSTIGVEKSSEICEDEAIQMTSASSEETQTKQSENEILKPKKPLSEGVQECVDDDTANSNQLDQTESSVEVTQIPIETVTEINDVIKVTKKSPQTDTSTTKVKQRLDKETLAESNRQTQINQVERSTEVTQVPIGIVTEGQVQKVIVQSTQTNRPIIQNPRPPVEKFIPDSNQQIDIHLEKRYRRPSTTKVEKFEDVSGVEVGQNDGWRIPNRSPVEKFIPESSDHSKEFEIGKQDDLLNRHRIHNNGEKHKIIEDEMADHSVEDNSPERKRLLIFLEKLVRFYEISRIIQENQNKKDMKRQKIRDIMEEKRRRHHNWYYWH